MTEIKECKHEDIKYDYNEKKYICQECGYEKKVEPKVSKCYRCGTVYTEYTWFDPSSCKHCKRSFVD